MDDDFQATSSNGVAGSRDKPRLRKRLRAYRARRRRKRQQRPKRPIQRTAVPSFFTLMNLLCGFLALAQVYEGQFIQACWLIVMAGFFDALDGMMARLTDSVSPFGVELDSLCDVVSFGVAPAFLLYGFGLSEFGMLGTLVAALPAICGAARLARFNVTFGGAKEDYFVGLPIPGQAMFVVALILNFTETSWLSRLSTDHLSVLIPVVVVLAGLMVSSISFDALPKPTKGYIREHPRKSVAYGIALLLLVFLHQLGLLIVLASYTLFGLGRAVYQVYDEVMNMPVEEEEFPDGPLPHTN